MNHLTSIQNHLHRKWENCNTQIFPDWEEMSSASLDEL